MHIGVVKTCSYPETFTVKQIKVESVVFSHVWDLAVSERSTHACAKQAALFVLLMIH